MWNLVQFLSGKGTGLREFSKVFFESFAKISCGHPPLNSHLCALWTRRRTCWKASFARVTAYSGFDRTKIELLTIGMHQLHIPFLILTSVPWFRCEISRWISAQCRQVYNSLSFEATWRNGILVQLKTFPSIFDLLVFSFLLLSWKSCATHYSFPFPTSMRSELKLFYRWWRLHVICQKPLCGTES